MALDENLNLGAIVFTAASAVVIEKDRGATIIAFEIPAAVDNSAVRVGMEVSHNGGTDYSIVATDVAGTATAYRPAFAVTYLLVLDPTISYAIESARFVRVTLYAADGTTVAAQTATTINVVYTHISRG